MRATWPSLLLLAACHADGGLPSLAGDLGAGGAGDLPLAVDLAPPGDLAAPADLAVPLDLTPPADLVALPADLLVLGGCLATSPDAVNFGGVPVNMVTRPTNVTLTNHCASTYELTAAQALGPAANEFLVGWGGRSVKLAPGDSYATPVVFLPLRKGPAASQLELAIFALGNLRVPLSGTGL